MEQQEIKTVTDTLMRIFVLCLLISVCTTTRGQVTEYEHFRIEDRQLIWQRVVDTAVSIDVAKSFYLQMPNTANLYENGNSLLVDVSNVSVDLRKYGKRWGTTPIITQSYIFSGKLRVDLKEDRYRMTFYGIELIPVNSSTMFRPTTFTAEMLKNSRESIRQAYAVPDILGIYERTFYDHFRIRNMSNSDDF
jgi:hypothetical protein